MQNEIKLINTQSLAELCNIFPKRISNSLMIYESIETTILNYKNGDSIYLHSDMVEYFINKILSKMTKPFIIVIGGNDFTMPFDYPSINLLLENENLIMIYSQNNVSDHPKIKHLPIGLDYHSLYYYNGIHPWSNEICPISQLEQEKKLLYIKNSLKNILETKPYAVTNFHLAMDGPPRRKEYRVPIYEKLKDKNCIIWLPNQTRDEFWKSLNDNMFVICPFGNGLDTHRTWEVLCLGRIPIIEKSPLNKVYENLPIIEVENWDQITNEWMKEKFDLIISNLKKNVYNFDKLELSYWKNEISNNVKKVAIVILAIGEKYINSFNLYFRNSVEKYCNKYNYHLIVLNELIKYEDNMNSKKILWQKMLIPEKYEQYDYVVVMDSDIYVSNNAPCLPLEDIPGGKVAGSNERKYFGNYEWRQKIQEKNGWEKTGIDWYKISNENKNYDDHLNSGFMIYQPKYHGEIIKKLYDDNIDNYEKYHQGDQSILSIFLIDNDLIYWLDQRYNRVWYFWKEIMYPEFDSYDIALKKKLISNFVNLNYFCHFTSMIDIDLL